MGGFSSIAIGTGLLAVSLWGFLNDYIGAALLFGGASLIFFARGFRGRDVKSVEDLSAPFDFLSNPAGAIVEAAIDKAGDVMKEAAPLLADDGGSKIDPDAVIARYLANRPEAPTPAALPAAAAGQPQAQRTFGRKGL